MPGGPSPTEGTGLVGGGASRARPALPRHRSGGEPLPPARVVAGNRAAAERGARGGAQRRGGGRGGGAGPDRSAPLRQPRGLRHHLRADGGSVASVERRIYGIETEYGMAEEATDRRLRGADPGKLFDY